MNIKRLFFVLLCVGVLLSGCEDILDVKPISTLSPDTFYQNEKEAELAIAAVYSDLARDDSYGRDISMHFEAGTDETVFSRASTAWSVAINSHNANTNEIGNAWARLYRGINHANFFIKRIANAELSEEKRLRYLAEARFLRAFYYFDLVRWWEHVPLRTEPVESRDGNHLAASNALTVYQQIIEDLDFASQNLWHPADADYQYGRASKTAALGMLSRVYLTMAGMPLEHEPLASYAKARDYADSVIADGYHGLKSDYRQVFLNQIKQVPDDEEVVFEIQFKTLRSQGIVEDGRVGNLNGVMIQLPGSEDPYAYAFMHVTPTHLKQYDQYNDARFSWNCVNYRINNRGEVLTRPVSDTHQWSPGKWRRVDYTSDAQGNNTLIKLEVGEIQKNFTSINFPVLRYSDILLMRAEAENELNGPNEAMAYLNEVRHRSGTGDVPAAFTSGKEVFREELMRERSRELSFEGHRKHDLRRWGVYFEKLEELKQDIVEAGVPASQAWYSRVCDNALPRHVVLPVPAKEMAVNRLIEQHPLWR